MIVGRSDEKEFLQSLIVNNVLGEAIDWINANLSPEDVFDESDLIEWADENLETGDN
jgi:hypothetical protein